MCWNPEVSIATYLVSLISITLAYTNGLMSLPGFLFLQSFITIQLVEFFLWIYLNDKNLNKLFSIIGFVLIMSQPFFSLLSIESSFKYKNLLIVCYLIFTLFIVSQKIEFKTIVGSDKHLQWKWLDWSLLIICVWFFFFIFRFVYNYIYLDELFQLLFVLITFGVCYYSFIKSKTWGSMWCWVANVVSLLYLYRLANK